MRRLRLFRRKRKPAPQAGTRTVEIVFTARDEFTPVLEDLERRLRGVEKAAKRAEKASQRAMQNPWWVCVECSAPLGWGHRLSCVSRGKVGYALPTEPHSWERGDR